MNWKKPVFMLGAVLLCTSLLMASTPPGTTTTATQIAPVEVNSAQAVLPDPVRVQKDQTVSGSMGLAQAAGAKPTGERSGEECPADALFGQIPHGPDESWSFATSSITTSFEYLVQENFWDVTSPMCDIHWWGLSLHYDSGWYACDPNGVTFDIVFYEDDDGAPGDAVCSYTGLTPIVTNTGLSYSGYEMFYYEILSLDPCCTLTDGWVSIQSQLNDNDCAFLWASSPDGDGDSLQGGSSTGYDRGVCLTGVYVEQFGACCDDYTGVCEDNVEIIDCEYEFTVDTLCADLDPPCGITGACCVDLVCTATTYEADCAGTWYEGETCPEFECPETDADFIVYAPFTSEILDACDGDDCDLRPYEEHEYEVVIPYAGTWNFNTCLNSEWDTYIYLGTTLCSYDLGYNDDSCSLQSEIELYLEPGNYFCTIEGYNTCGNYVFDVYDATPYGACCVGVECVGDMYQSACTDLGGILYEDETCDDFECPVVPDNDLCENAEPINAPYPVTVTGDNTAATIDCPDLLDEWIAVWYEIELPYESNIVEIQTCPTAVDVYTSGIILMDDCACDDYIVSSYEWITCDNDLSGLFQTWEDIAGPGTILFPCYVVDSSDNGMEFELVFNVTEDVPCVVECPEGAVEEQEECGEDTNGGCNMDDPTFEAIECNTTICGTGWYDGSTRDTDWYELVLTESSILTISLEAEFDALFGKIGQYVDGVAGCDNTTGSVDPYALPDECEPASVVTECLPAGTYYVFVAPQFNTVVECPADYVLTVECETCVILGACCYGDDPNNPVCEDLTEDACEALDGDWYSEEECATFDCPVPCDETQIDITILTDSYPSETSWEITDHVTGVEVCSGGGYSEDATYYYERCCILYTDCVDFTIYDSYGDGILDPGGYIVYVDGEEIANTMGGGFDGDEDTVEQIGDGCIPDTGACCDADLVCVETNTEEECDAMGGAWYIFEECPDFECPPCEYCTPCYSDPDDDYITNVTFNTINNETGIEDDDCHYGDYTYLSTEVEAEATYQISVSVGSDNGYWTEYVSVWFDWNLDCEFEDVYQLGYVVTDPASPATITGDITVPADALVGYNLRMRVIERYYEATTDPCEEYTYGEAEDYTVVVVPGICGDLDYDNDVDTDDYWMFLDTFGTCVGDTKYNEDADFDDDDCITLVDYQAWLQCYRDANGKSFIVPTPVLNSRPAGQQAPRLLP